MTIRHTTARLLFALILAFGLVSVPQAAQGYDYPVFSIRACASVGEGGNGHVCMKIYVKRQNDGHGWLVTSHHIYAYSEGNTGGVACGPRFNDPAIDPGHTWFVNELRNGDKYVSWNPLPVTVGDAQACERFYFGGSTSFAVLTDRFEADFTVHVNTRLAPDATKTLRIQFYILPDDPVYHVGHYVCWDDVDDCQRN